MLFSQSEKHFLIMRLRIRLLIFIRLTAHRDNLMRLYSCSIPYKYPLFNFESSNLIYVVICQECKEKYLGERRNGLSRERTTKYLQRLYKTAPISTIGSSRTFTYLRRRRVSYFSFFKIFQKKNHLENIMSIISQINPNFAQLKDLLSHKTS